jgi:hemophore-related protein
MSPSLDTVDLEIRPVNWGSRRRGSAIRNLEGVPHMVTRSMSKLAAAAGGLALSVIAGAGIASADGLSPAAINTTCNYDQVVRALDAQSPGSGTKLANSGMASGFLQRYLASPPPQRIQMAQQAQAQFPTQANQYLPMINQVAVTCNNF